MADHNSSLPSAPLVEVSVVIPCLNEAETVSVCIRKAGRALAGIGITSEIIVVDNGSTDASAEVSQQAGARVILESERGYGSALMAGIVAARGDMIIIGDADDSYDFCEIGRFVAEIRQGFDLVQGCRLPEGGGRIERDAMPWLHRWVGNPALTFLARAGFGVRIHDINCGMRAFRKSHLEALDLRCTGMEFAAEMIIKSALHGGRLGEVPITLHRDGRVAGRPHLKTFRDGWRTLRLYLLYSPRWLFAIPGISLILLGLMGCALSFPGARILGVTLGIHTLLFSTLAIVCGYQSLIFAVLMKVFALSERLLPSEPFFEKFISPVRIECALVVGALSMLIGLGLLGFALWRWKQVDFGNLNSPETMRIGIPAAMLIAMGFQTILGGFFLGLLSLKRR